MTQRGVVDSICVERLRALLYKHCSSHQFIRNWKSSPNTLLDEEERKIDQVARRRHNTPIVRSMDDTGPIQSIPHGGQGCSPRRVPAQIPDEYEK